MSRDTELNRLRDRHPAAMREHRDEIIEECAKVAASYPAINEVQRRLVAAAIRKRKRRTMKAYEFTIIASGLDPQADDFYDRFYEAGCDDATIAYVNRYIIVEFEREAKNFSHALATAIRDVRKAGATVEQVRS